jgi:lipase
MRLHAQEWGDPAGRPVVCLHGVLGHTGRFRKLAQERLAACRVVALDLRGHGHSGWEPPWDLDTQVDDLRETVSALGIDRATWIGHSFGGRLVMELTARAPELVERAALLDPAVWVPPEIALQRAERERVERVFASVEEAIESRIAVGNLYHSPRELLEEEMREHLVQDGEGRFRYRCCQSAVIAAYGEMSRPPPPFASLQVRTLLVRGALTDVVPETLADVYGEALGAQIEVVTVPGGHTVLWDAYEETADAIDRFLAG